jgi:hypothetical protein
MQHVTLTYKEDCDHTGESGWLVSHRGNNSLNYSEMFTSNKGVTLAHDILEH